jgi:GNAT superfamily N-acetyltransferase
LALEAAIERMIRPLQDDEYEQLWKLKRAFELELGTTGDDAKARTYEQKLDDAYRQDYRAWVQRCTEEDERTVLVAPGETELRGYAFILPESLAHIWDAAVLNEIFVRPEYRGTTVADDLMEEVLSVARSQDLPMNRIVLDVDRTNDRAVEFYEQWDFEHWGEMVARDL